jgi:23S rRNA pseudouridine1911/1915/1917 synthase
MKFIIKKEQIGQRLDKFILAHWPNYSRSYLQKQIKAGAVLVNQEIKKPSYSLKENDKIEAQILPPPEISLEPDVSIKLKIIYEDKDVIVVDKPADLTVHPGTGQKNGTLVNGLLARYPLLKDVGEPLTGSGQENLRPGIVHRLDKDTSGLMIIAKNNNAFDWLKKQFQERKVDKKYIALVAGHPKESNGQIKTFISRSKSIPTKQTISTQGKEAVTDYKVIKKYKNFTLIEAQPKTGRMHQIRVHLAWLGCPVAGDKKYGRKNQFALPGLKRHFLHASELTISLPSGQKRTFVSVLPEDMGQTLALLKKS